MTVGSDIKKILVIGDAYVSPATLSEAAATLGISGAEIVSCMWGTGNKDEFTRMQTLLERDGPEAVPLSPELEEAVCDADVLMVHFCPVSAALIARTRRLKLVGVCRGGFENIDAWALAERGIPLIHVIRNAEAVAEFTLGLMLAETRNIARSHEALRRGIWAEDYPNAAFTSTLQNLKVGVVGLGNIGALVVKKLRALNVPVMGYDAYLPRERLKTFSIEIASSMREIFQESDIISLHLRLTEENRGIVGGDLLRQMKPTAYIINASRAGLVDEAALLEILSEHKIAGAALDVFQQEPIEQDSPLLKLDNVTLTPHIAGDTVDSIERSPFPLAANMKEYLETGDRRNVCN